MGSARVDALCVLSWNVHGLPFRSATPRRIVRIAERIASEQPDVVFLQEVWFNRYRRILARHLATAYDFVYEPRRRTRRPRGGLLLLIRRDSGWYAQRERAFTTFAARAPWYRLNEADGVSGKGILNVRLANGGRSLLLTATHLQAQYGARVYHAERKAQLEQLMRVIGTGSDGPHLIAGDFNTTVEEELYASHLVALGDDLTVRERERCADGGTHFDRHQARLKWIDYVFARNLPAPTDITRIRNHAADDPYSDHDGLLLRWRLPSAARAVGP